jgi:hypothetical protein
VAVAHKEDPDADFRQAAALAWNRSVELPVEDPAAKPYYETVARLLADGTGTLRFAAPPDGATWYLDGVLIGTEPAQVNVFPGVHRVTAKHDGMIRTFKKDVQVQAHRLRDVAAVFPPTDDANWVRAQVRDAFTTQHLPKEVMELVSAWCARKNVTTVRLVQMDDAGQLKLVTYDATLRRVGPG